MTGRRGFLALGIAALAAPHVVRAQPLVDVEVAVIGAGAAGIATARQLSDWGYDVAVLEARGRVGGRAWTDAGALGQPWDRGAQWLHNARRNPLLPLARAAGLATTPSIFENMQVLGRADAPMLMAAFDRLDTRIDRAVDGAPPGATLADLATSDATDAAALALAALSIGGDPGQVSLRDAAMQESGEDVLIGGGPAGLLGHLAADLALYRNHAVDHVDFRPADHVVVAGAFGALRASMVVITVPPPVLAMGAVRFTPALPSWKQTAFAALQAADFVKVGLRLPGPVDGAEFATDLPALIAGRGALLHLDPRAPLAAVLFAGAHARALVAEGDRALAAAANAVLRQHIGVTALASDSHDWAADPFSQAPWARLRPGADRARADYIRPIDARLFFAGEAAPGPFATTLGGAWQSGLAAANAIWAAS
jgi:monoamine oxidase